MESLKTKSQSKNNYKILVTGGAGSTREMMANIFDSYYYVYILRSLADGNKYTGYTQNLPSRFEAHQAGRVDSTKHRRPFELIYFEACLNREDALKREKYLKTHYGKMFLGNRLKSYFTGQEKIWKNYKDIKNE